MKRTFLASFKTLGTTYYNSDSYRTIRVEVRDSKKESKVLDRVYKKVDSLKSTKEWLIELYDCNYGTIKKFTNRWDR